MADSLFTDTIFALSSGALPSGVAVIRLAGPDVFEALSQIAGPVPPERKAALRRVTDRLGDTIDHALVLYFKGPRSFTGEDCAELHVHGGRAVVAAVLDALGGIPGLRQAQAGEFTHRAFLHGKMDLTGAEALADLVVAETESQRRLAVENADGRQRVLYEAWAKRLLHGRAMIEAELDFADEGDVPGSVSDVVWADMQALASEIGVHIEGYRVAEIIRDGFRVVLVGRPNAGKSSLVNALARRDVAIVTDVAGTTRDLIEVSLDLEGVKVIVTDTAGMRETEDVVERIGVMRAVEAAQRADLILTLTDMSAAEGAVDNRAELDAPLLHVGTKSDLPSPVQHRVALQVSAQNGDGLDVLVQEIRTRAAAASGRDGHAVPSRRRHVDLLRQAVRHVDRAVTNPRRDTELRAEELRLAAFALEQITGRSGVEDLLGVIFSEFCVGK